MITAVMIHRDNGHYLDACLRSLRYSIIDRVVISDTGSSRPHLDRLKRLKEYYGDWLELHFDDLIMVKPGVYDMGKMRSRVLSYLREDDEYFYMIDADERLVIRDEVLLDYYLENYKDVCAGFTNKIKQWHLRLGKGGVDYNFVVEDILRLGRNIGVEYSGYIHESFLGSVPEGKIIIDLPDTVLYTVHLGYAGSLRQFLNKVRRNILGLEYWVREKGHSIKYSSQLAKTYSLIGMYGEELRVLKEILKLDLSDELRDKIDKRVLMLNNLLGGKVC